MRFCGEDKSQFHKLNNTNVAIFFFYKQIITCALYFLNIKYFYSIKCKFLLLYIP
jgi:hypothetical protein